MTTDPVKAWADSVAEFRDEAAEGKRYDVLMVPTQYFDSMIKAADEGDLTARRCATAFTDWTASVAAAARSSARPGCFRCKRSLVPLDEGGEGIGGIALIMPHANPGKGSVGLVAAVCPSCSRFGRDALFPYLREAIEEETGLKSLGVQ